MYACACCCCIAVAWTTRSILAHIAHTTRVALHRYARPKRVSSAALARNTPPTRVSNNWNRTLPLTLWPWAERSIEALPHHHHPRPAHASGPRPMQSNPQSLRLPRSTTMRHTIQRTLIHEALPAAAVAHPHLCRGPPSCQRQRWVSHHLLHRHKGRVARWHLHHLLHHRGSWLRPRQHHHQQHHWLQARVPRRLWVSVLLRGTVAEKSPWLQHCLCLKKARVEVDQ
jgi:hypothetical protein